MDGTFRYDGGPNQPVPMPKQEVAPKATERLVSNPAPKKYTYAAYGEESGPQPQPRNDAKTYVVKGTVK